MNVQTLFSLISCLHCKKYQYAVFLLPGLLWGFTCSSCSLSSSCRYRSSWTSGLVFLNHFLVDMSTEREPKFSRSGRSRESEGSGTLPPRAAVDRDRDLAVKPLGKRHGSAVRSLDVWCCEKNAIWTGFVVLCEFFLTDQDRANLILGAETVPLFRTHEETTDNIFSS